MLTTRQHPLLNGVNDPPSTDPIKDFEAASQFGEEQSKKVGGDARTLESFLFMFYDQDNETSSIRQEIFQLERDNDANKGYMAEQNKVVEGLRQSVHTYNRERDRLVADRQNEIASKKVEIKRIKGGDFSLLGTDANPANRLAYAIASMILMLLTMYLICFYASVIYNGFLLDPYALLSQNNGQSIVLTVTIANVRAFPLVAEQFGFWGVLFLFTGTFVFITLGFLVHWFNQSKSKIWIYALYVFTFLFDGFLAYEIVRKIHESKVITGETLIPWVPKMAFQQMEFYIILFAGFGIYIAWGLLLRYLLEEHHKILPARAGIQRRRAEIDKLNQEIKDIQGQFGQKTNDLQKEVNDLSQREISLRANEIQNNEVKIKSLREKLRNHLQRNGLTAQKLRAQVTPFFTGWTKIIWEVFSQEEAQKRVDECHEVINRFFKTVGLN